MAKKRRKSRKKKAQNQMTFLLLFIGMIMVGCLLYAMYQKSMGQITEEEQINTTENEAGGAETVEEPEKGETQPQETEEAKPDENTQDTAVTPDGEPLEYPNEDSEENPEGAEGVVSPQATMNADGATWTTFDGYTMGSCSSTFGTIFTREQIAALDGTKQGYGQGVNVDDKNRPTGATMLQTKYEKYGALYIAPDSMNIYLTMDEGYENGYSEKIMDALKSCNCHGVFFVTMDYVKKNPELVQRMIDEGHVLGNHSVSHKSMPTLSLEEQSNEIKQLHDYVKEQFGYDMYLFRPPMGEYSEQTLALAQSLGYRVTLWSYAYKDYDTENQPDPGETYQKVMAAKHGGAIYLLHAVSSTNCAIMPDFVSNLRSQGYEVGPIPR